MEYVQIPVPDFSFEAVAKEKADFIAKQLLHPNAIRQYSPSNRAIEQRLEIQINSILGKEEQIVCISELLSFLHTETGSFSSQSASDNDSFQRYVSAINQIRYFLYSLARLISGYTFDKNGFSDDTIANLSLKIDMILEALNKVQVGQEVIFEEFETIRNQIKLDFESLKTDFPLGKEKFSKIALGTIRTYAGNKIADMIFDQIKPYLVAFFTVEAPHMIGHLEKFLNQ